MEEDTSTDCVQQARTWLRNASKRCLWILLDNKALSGLMELTSGSMELMWLKEPFQKDPSGLWIQFQGMTQQILEQAFLLDARKFLIVGQQKWTVNANVQGCGDLMIYWLWTFYKWVIRFNKEIQIRFSLKDSTWFNSWELCSWLEMGLWGINTNLVKLFRCYYHVTVTYIVCINA